MCVLCVRVCVYCVCTCVCICILHVNALCAMFVVAGIHSLQLLTSHSDTQLVDIANDHNIPEGKSDTTRALRSTKEVRKRTGTYKVSINIKYFKPSPGTSATTRIKREQILQHANTIQPSLVTMEFLDLKFQLEKMLQQCDPMPIVKRCGSLLASDTHNIPLFPTDYAERLQGIEHTPELIQKLSPFMTWDNHTILSTIAETSNIPEATMLLTQFDDRIDSSQPLTSFPIPAPSHHMVPYDNTSHTVLAVKLDLELHQSTLQNALDARSLIQDQCKLTSHCLQLLAVAKTNSTILYWMIPKSIAHLITANAVQFQNDYHQKGILQLAVYPGAMLCIESALKVGPLSFFNQLVVDGKLVSVITYLNYLVLFFVQETKNASDSLNMELSQVEVRNTFACISTGNVFTVIHAYDSCY